MLNEAPTTPNDFHFASAADLEELLPIAYKELRRLAAFYLQRERSNHTLQATALVHEAYLRLVGQNQVCWQNRAHFFAIAAQMMRRILVDYARTHHREKRGGLQSTIALEDTVVFAQQKTADLIALDEALTRFAELFPRKCRVIELRYFGGLSVEETAEVLGVSRQTVLRDWDFAKAWLYQELTGDEEADS